MRFSKVLFQVGIVVSLQRTQKDFKHCFKWWFGGLVDLVLCACFVCVCLLFVFVFLEIANTEAKNI